MNGSVEIENSLNLSEIITKFFPRETLKTPDWDKKVYLCIGSDKIVFDSLGPLVGSLLKKNKSFCGYVYGTMSNPVTALSVDTAIRFIRRFHFGAIVTVIDSAVGKREDIGKIKYYERGLRPALGMDKQMQIVGDRSIMGIVSTKDKVKNIYDTSVKLKDVYAMAEKIAESIVLGEEEKFKEYKEEYDNASCSLKS